MPNQTFFNLPAEKREQILQVAIDEFAENDFANVSISRIVARAGIAKGSFYQYFADKEDLYAYLLGMLLEAKKEFTSMDHPDPQHLGIYAYLRWTTERGVALQLAYPKLSQIALRAVKSGKFPKAFDEQVRRASMDFYRRLVEVGQQQGDIASDVDPELAAVIFESVLSSVSDLVVQRLAGAHAAVLQGTQHVFDVPDVAALFERTVEILEHGLGNRGVERGGVENGQIPQARLA